MSAYLVGLARKARLYSGTRKNVLWVLVDCCHEDGTRIYPALKTLAEDAECSVSTARRTLKEFCRIGLLRRVRDGGNGPRSTAHYELDVELLLSLRRPETWPALEAASMHEPLTDGEDDGDDDHAPDASSSLKVAEPCENKGVTVEAFHHGSLPNEPLRVSPDDTQPLSRTLSYEREGVRAHEQAPAIPVPADPQTGTPTFMDLLEAYPHSKVDNRSKLRAAWEALPFEQRRLAVDAIPAFLADRKVAGYKGRMPATEYISGQNWIGLEAKAAQRAATVGSGAPVTIAGYTRDWWYLLFDRIADGKDPDFWIKRAEAGGALGGTTAGLAAAAKRIGELKPYRCAGPEMEAWRPWLAARRARIGVLKGDFMVFLPGPLPPGGRADAGDDEVKF